MVRDPQLILASSSPRRHEILGALGLDFTVRCNAVDESPQDGETPREMVLRLAALKAGAIDADAEDLVIGADTAVVIDDVVLGKPRDRDDAISMLMALSGRTHAVLTGVALRAPDGVRTALSATDVRFREIDRDEAALYWQSGEPLDKAGAYAIQGIGGVFVEEIAGSYSGVVGLPVFETVQLLREAGIDVLLPPRREDAG